jgi:hypothetical protein
MKKYLTSLAITRMQIKPTLRFHTNPVKMAIIKKSNNNTSKDAGKKEPSYTACGNITSTTSMEISMGVHQKLKKDLPCDPAIPLLVMYLKEYKSIYK